MAESSEEMEFRLYGSEGETLVEGAAQIKYLGRPLDQTDDNWTEVQRNAKRAQKVWGILGKILQREGADTKVLEMFYRVVVHKVLLFGSESWVALRTIFKVCAR